MADPQPDIKTLYNEGCNALRHYSLCVMNMRTVTIAQGIVILSAAIYLINQRAFHPSLWLCVFGGLFTFVLHMLQKSYWEHFEKILDAVEKIELNADQGRSPIGPWHVYKTNRDSRYGKTWWRLLVRHGPFLLILSAFLTVSLYDVFQVRR